MHIVVVDGSRVVLRLLTELLEDQGHSVLAFTNGQKAYEQIATDPTVDVLITSFEVPGKSGLELCWETRILAQSRRPIYVIAMSSTTEKTQLIQALDSGADDFFSKPPVYEELRARIRAAQRLIDMQNELVRLATRDPLTDIFNRRAFFEQAEDHLSSNEDDTPVSAMMFDIDHFKSINDNYGHDVGDEVIKAVAHICRDGCDDTGHILGRLGGEEFAILSPDTSLDGGLSLAETYRQKIEELEIQTRTGPVRCTCSFGVSVWTNRESLTKLLKQADTALYHAKNNGRNRVAAFRETDEATAS
ncbi:GGDEF domain-containing response regulator [Coralliovum pocilloporae]|uniref:GGDEF domain-containing response regulator n=1 Tax=Coralliovum pocilloporae TaxID=3066369 RepID=UPI0033074E57